MIYGTFMEKHQIIFSPERRNLDLDAFLAARRPSDRARVLQGPFTDSTELVSSSCPAETNPVLTTLVHMRLPAYKPVSKIIFKSKYEFEH